jgi:predicted ArsR family transcriptional regulator
MAEPDPHRVLQRQARALGEPTRYRIFRYVAEAGRPVSVAEITAHVALHHNGVRQHLAKLCDADLLTEEFTGGGGPGRPALQYRLASAASRFLI